ncbi:MAG: hypothetical protein SF123_23890 [Chloroflexota bacterium]|nr:hypothetical protein [Chloroflexota bacterium]
MMEAGLNEFVQQLPPIFLYMFCGSGILLLFSSVMIVNARRKKAKLAAAANGNTVPGIPLLAYDSPDLPDLDSLLQGGSAAAAPARRGGTQAILLSDGSSADAVELITIMRDITTGGLIVQMHDKAYRVSSVSNDADFKSKLRSILQEVATGVGGTQPLAQARPAAPAMAALPTPAPVTAPRPAAPGSFDLPRYSLDSAPTPMTRKELKRAIEQPIPELNIAGAIEAYLQHKLASGGQHAGRGLHVRASDDGGIRIELDGQAYETVDDVQDADVRTFLKQTIQEWQDRQ